MSERSAQTITRERKGLKVKTRKSSSTSEPLTAIFQDLSEHARDYFGQEGPLEFQILEHQQKRLSEIWRCAVSHNGWHTHIFIKMHKNPDHRDDRVLQFCATEFDILKELYAAFAPYEQFGVVRPVAFYPREMITITEEKAGDNLYNLLQKQSHRLARHKSFRELERYCYLCGKWLRVFQKITSTGKTRHLEELGILANADERFRRWQALHLNQSLMRRVKADLQERIRRLTDRKVPISGQHGDFIPFNIIVNPNEVTLLDFPYYCEGTVYHDLARFCTVLITMAKKPQYSRRRMQRLVKNTLSGFAEYADFDPDIFGVYLRYNMIDWVLWDEWLNRGDRKNRFWRRRVKSFYENCFRNFDHYAIA
ncbi:MAG: phosphotransferase [candidate division KSB1 bacterium]|nr:phosphotransferase [candidate division KSB1 bacterium]